MPARPSEFLCPAAGCCYNSPLASDSDTDLAVVFHKYELDGRDPNGFAGVAWCFGKHDRPWASRPVFGNIRYMSAEGLRRKFDADGYVKRGALPEEPRGR